jgi:hypothetical protein
VAASRRQPYGRRYAVYLAGCASRPERCAVHGGPGYLARAAQRCETVSLSRPGYHFGASAAERRLRAQSELAGLCDDRARRHPPTRWGRLLTLAARFRWDPRGRLELPGWWVAGSVPQDKRRGKVSRGRLPPAGTPDQVRELRADALPATKMTERPNIARAWVYRILANEAV